MWPRQPPSHVPSLQHRLYAVAGGLIFVICVASICCSLIFQFVHCPQCGRSMREVTRYRESSSDGIVSLYHCGECQFSVMR